MKISQAEGVVMETLWQESPLPAEMIVARIPKTQDWSEATVKTLINRLLTKGAIRAEKEGRRYLYRPVLDRGAYVTDESEDLLSRLFGGRVAPLVSHFSQHRKLSPQDIAELKALIQEIDNDE